MPIYEYVCDDCGHDFELLVRGSDTPTCPECESAELSRQLSLPKVKSAKTRQKAMRAAKQRDRRQGESQMRERIEYESNHD
ncbi:MAG TPA: zinc ribbon domain-containing protein [Longimicrobiales bacterium]|nr:zinc ribbon domain-containing protein [Longimicrobiales bacterium]